MMLKKIYYGVWNICFKFWDKFQKKLTKIYDTITLQDFEPPNNQAYRSEIHYITLLKKGVVYENNNGKEVYLYPYDMPQEELIEIIKEHKQI